MRCRIRIKGHLDPSWQEWFEHLDILPEPLGGGLKDAGWNGEHLVPSQLAILPGATHYNITFRTELLLPILAPFLDK